MDHSESEWSPAIVCSFKDAASQGLRRVAARRAALCRGDLESKGQPGCGTHRAVHSSTRGVGTKWGPRPVWAA